jgi:Domain of unknown function (DUF4167)
MRPGQKNRMRGGRGGNNSNSGGGSRRGPNPLTRSYESNGPDVKVRGTPQHIAEKYVQLARDAHTASDIVMAESYLQHAEHYYRIISAAHNAQQVAYNQSMGIQNTNQDDVQDNEDEFEVVGADRFTFQAPQVFQPPGQNQGQGAYPQAYAQPFGDPAQNGEQPSMGDMPVMEGSQPNYQPSQQPRGDRSFGNRRPFGDRGDRPERPDRQDRGERQERSEQPGERPMGDRQERGDRGPRRFGRDRPFGDRPFNDRNSAERGNGEPRAIGERSANDRPAERGGYAPRQNEQTADFVADPQPVLPSFITAPVRVVATENASPVAATSDPALKVRRRRRVRNAEGALVESED